MENHMKKRWEIRRVSTPERIFKKIQAEMAQPVGIILFGPDDDFTKEVVDEMASGLGNSARWYRKIPRAAALAKAFKKHSTVAVVLNPQDSSVHTARHNLVKTLQESGAKSIIGVYVKMQPYSQKVLVRAPDAFETNRQIDAIERSHPTTDGLDYFIVIKPDQ